MIYKLLIYLLDVFDSDGENDTRPLAKPNQIDSHRWIEVIIFSSV